MPKTIVEQLPFFDQPTSLRIPGGVAVSIKQFQIIVWVAITDVGLPDCPDEAPRLPAVVDTGFNHNFVIQSNQLHDWAGIQSSDLIYVSNISVRGQRVPLREADVWIFPNQPGFRDQLLRVPPFRLQLDSGIAICADDMQYPRLPLIGLRAICRNQLDLQIDATERRVTIYVAD